MEYIPYGRQYIDQEDINAVVDILKSDWLTQGPKIKEFEDAMAAYHGCDYAVSFSSGTAALHGAYYVSTKFPFGKKGVCLEDKYFFTNSKSRSQEEYDKYKNHYWEFITTPSTFVASANGGLYCGGSAKFVDIDINTYCIDLDQIESSITEDTRVITPVSYAGYPIDIKAIKNLHPIKQNNICIIHDASHALGARRNGHGIADFADMTILSFHPVKHITTAEGGMVLTNNKEYYEKLVMFRNHGITKDPTKFFNRPDGDWYYEMQELGYNYRLTDLQCALGVTQLKKADKFIYKRNQIARMYEKELRPIEWISLPPGFNKDWLERKDYNELITKPENLHSYHLFPVILDRKIDRRKFYEYLKGCNIGVQVHYIPVNQQFVYSDGKTDTDTPNANDFYNRELSLPMYYALNDDDFQRIIEVIKRYKI